VILSVLHLLLVLAKQERQRDKVARRVPIPRAVANPRDGSRIEDAVRLMRGAPHEELGAQARHLRGGTFASSLEDEAG
jgi:hypothetical protein